jgi:VWFA-related protein
LICQGIQLYPALKNIENLAVVIYPYRMILFIMILCFILNAEFISGLNCQEIGNAAVFPGHSPCGDNIQKKDDGYAIDMTVKRVMLDVTVRDAKGKYYADLSAENFKIYENGVLQKIDAFGFQKDNPLSIVFLLDVSGSMSIGKKLDIAKQSIRYFVSRCSTRDEFAAYIFADEGFETLASFQRNKSDFFERLEEIKAYGKTGILDAIALAQNFVLGAHNSRLFVLILSDGVDNYSKTTLESALGEMHRLKCPLYAFAIKNLPGAYYPQDEFSGDLLNQCSRESGGEFFVVSDENDYMSACTTLESAIRSSYSIGYKSSLGKDDKKFRTIRIELTGRNLIATYRKGYYP